MHILVLGGTRFVGLHVVEAALAAGHRVDVFSRGSSPIPPGTRHVPGDRDGDLSGFDGGWDAVVDVSAYLPRQVRASAERLSGRVRRYLFVSAAAVYDFAQATPPAHEDAALRTLADPASETIDGETYGGLKVLCERAAVGAVNASGPAERTTWGEVLALAREVTGSDADFEWLPEDFLRERGALPSGLPMVYPVPWREVEPFALERAHRLGLEHTDVAATIRDTLAWHDAHGEAITGLDEVAEAELLRAWDGR
jgi:nucleoside-diphosphate-sugar epimerase